MVITKLYGGLGNQMFQYAAGKALSSQLNSALFFDDYWFDLVVGHPNATERVFELSTFGITPTHPGIIEKISLRLNPPMIIKEKDMDYQPELKNATGNIVLDGYWQSYKYFVGYENDIRNGFRFKETLSPIVKKILKEIRHTDSVALHVRRGDYVNTRRTSFIGLIPLSYYKKALEIVIARAVNPVIFIFSDDPGWCRNNLNLKNNIKFISDYGSTTAAEEMMLMSACRHNIIANSTFSWWGAWLNDNPNKIICAPKIWYKGTPSTITDRIPEDWIKL